MYKNRYILGENRYSFTLFKSFIKTYNSRSISVVENKVCYIDFVFSNSEHNSNTH